MTWTNSGADAPSIIARSSDGVSWSPYGTIGLTSNHVFLDFREGKFVSYGDLKTSFQSVDGKTFTPLAIEEATFCENTWKSFTDCHMSSWFGGVYLREDWPAKITRSTNGTAFSLVYTDTQGNTIYQARAIAEGYVAAP
jgi:hypothetical protein